ncbi:IMPACT family member YigZ [Mariprofundus micogutta]|uniref:IMPACT family member YigZ n=1 Tax=Mariprofundus micogutta TaxID=1921010 RepID=A0A1L8CJS1_9PROT|nr:YigZ family protein [Mariprofundus micogutta]GAV19135.1 IMPACT family member YigZ [Mariprofundus micogutta]
MSSSYSIPSKHICVEQEIKRSRFVADIGHAESKADAIAFIDLIKKREPEARHHCWAYIAGHPIESIERGCSDAGEPQGTAGKPMLNVLQHKGIGEIVVVVSRYFGGIKLGAGGLVRAYASSVQQAIDALPLSQHIVTVPAVLNVPFALENQTRRLLDHGNIVIKQTVYKNDVEIFIEVEAGKEPELEESLTNMSSGRATVIFPESET